MSNLVRLVSILVLLSGCGAAESDDDPPETPAPRTSQATVGVHYYTWYDELHHWDKGIAHQPLLGQYRSEDRRVAEQHIEWMASAGIDVAAVEWFRPDYAEAHLRLGLLRASNLHKIRWCLFYDTDVRLQGFDYTNSNRIDFGDPFVYRTVVNDVVRLAEQFFAHPRYYRIDGRPVVWMYLTRSYVGPWPEAIAEIRRRTAALGFPIYLIADEVWYTEPDTQRLQSFDAVSAYSMYDVDRTRGRSDLKLPEFYQQYAAVFENWQQKAPRVNSTARNRPVVFQPSVAPQFDDGAVRGSAHPPVYAHSREEVIEAFARTGQLAERNPNPEERVVWITSFNEWHEGTSIEPTVSGGAPFPGGNYGFELLNAVSSVFGGTRKQEP